MVDVNPDVKWALDDVRGRAQALADYRDYYEGRHRPMLPDPSSTSTVVVDLLERLRDNMCDDVVDEPVSRLNVVSWSGRAEDQDEAAEDRRGALAQEVWDANRGPARERRTYTDQAWAGDAYNIVERGADGVVRWFPQDPRQMAVRYFDDRPDVIAVAAKVWLEPDGKRWRLNLYYHPEAARTPGVLLERYATKGTSPGGGLPQPSAFLPTVGPEDAVTGEPDMGVRDWTRCPVFHFPADEVGRYGRSVLSDVIPLQDLLNKALVDWVVNAEDVALPQRFAVGVQRETDPVTGEDRPIRRRTRRASDMLAIASAPSGEHAVQLGQFEGADMAQWPATVQAHRVEIARKGYLPPSSVSPTGDTAVSGLSLLVQEGRQVKRCKAWQRDNGWVWREQMAYMLTLAGTPCEAADLDVEWAPPNTRDEAALWELAALKQALGVPRRVLLVEGGYDARDVDAWLEAEAAEQGGRVSMPGVLGGVASVTVPGMSGGMAVPGGALPAPPVQPNGAGAPALPTTSG